MSNNYESSVDFEFQLDAQPAVAAFISGRRKFLDFLRARVSDPTDAEEILQRASVKILERGADLRESTSAEAWIYRLLRNELVNHYRRTALHSKKTVEMPPDFDRPAPMPALEARPCPCATAEMSALIPDYADSLRSLEMQDETVPSYAARKGISVNNAGVRLHRARKALRARVEAKCGQCAGAGCFSCSCAT
jgi:DNA-directed RNA polymerase specialized sigma24 family protein